MKSYSVLKFLLRMVDLDDLLLPSPRPVLSKAEAVERVRAYAETNQKRFHEPNKVYLTERFEGTGDARRRVPVYEMALGSHRPMPFVVVDALTGEIRSWRSLPR